MYIRQGLLISLVPRSPGHDRPDVLGESRLTAATSIENPYREPLSRTTPTAAVKLTRARLQDENRDYGAKYGGGAYAVAMHDMVKRDRNHASVIMWSFCNEAECSQVLAAPRPRPQCPTPFRPAAPSQCPHPTPRRWLFCPSPPAAALR